MTDRYFVKVEGRPGASEQAISQEIFQRLLDAQAVLKWALVLEENYEIVISNYLEFENSVNQIATEQMVRHSSEYRDYFDVRLRLNTRLVNLLTAVRLYFDSLGANVSGCLPNEGSMNAKVDQVRREEHSHNAGYRFMEALRNYAQHRGTPVHLFRLSSRSVELDDSRYIEYSVDFMSERLKLEEDKTFKKDVLREIGESIDLKSSTRNYLGCISRIHSTMRGMIDEAITAARDVIHRRQIKYGAHYSGALIGLCAYHVVDEVIDKRVPLTLDWDDVRQALVRNNPELRDLEKRYVTGK